MNKPIRTFEDAPAERKPVALLLGITGASFSGKTWSALRLAVGIQRVSGGDIFVIDTENGRASHYAQYFKFRTIDMQPPFGPRDYMAAIEHCIKRGAGVIIVDSMSHEHNGPGGVMDQSDKFLDAKCGDDWRKRKSNFMLSLAEPKKQRKELNLLITRSKVHMILCYRGADKIKPVAGDEPIKLGWQPETTSTLPYDMTQRFLLEPGAHGVPTLHPVHAAEKQMVKSPEQFRDWFKDGQALDEDIGERMARWAVPDAKAAQPAANGNGNAKPPTFRSLADAEWQNRPLREGTAEVLRNYWSAVKEQVDGMPDSRQKSAAERHLEDVHRELEAAMAEEAQQAGVAP